MESQHLMIKNVHLLDGVSVDMVGWLTCMDGTIQNFGVEQPPFNTHEKHYQIIDGCGLTLVPGFIDIHVHGALGAEAMDADEAGLLKMAAFYAKHGVTGFLPTTWAAELATLKPVLSTIKNLMMHQINGAQILGSHLEGPYINAGKAGAQNPEYILKPEPALILPLLNLDVVKLITLAPEIAENDWLIHECVRRGITVSAGHTDATYDQIIAAVEKGVNQTTHTFNAMKGLHHREPGTVGAALSLDTINCEVIADTIHLHPAILNLIFRAKGNDRIILVTDAMRGTGLPDGEYPVDERIITIKNGAARLPGGQLAGSTLTMDTALRNMIEATGASLQQILPALTINPARSIKLSNRKGSLAVGKDADLVLLDEVYTIKMTIVGGQIIHTS